MVNINNQDKATFFSTIWGKIVFISLIIIFLIFLFDKIIMPIYTNHGEVLSMPNIAGQDTVEAKKSLMNLNLIPVMDDSQYTEITGPGKILTQKPEPGAHIKEGRRVYITFSKGKRPLFMPNMTARGFRDGSLVIEQIGLVIGQVSYKYSSNIAGGTISGQSIPPGDPISPGDIIDITVSKGPSPDKLSIPDVINRPLKIALKRLEMVGLPVDSIIYVQVSSSIPDIVIRQSLDPGKMLRPGDKIVLTVTKN